MKPRPRPPQAPAPGATLTSDEAAALLGIKRETLYAYASRGLVRGLPGARGQGRRYRAEDLQPLRERQAGPAAAALRFGEPVLDTQITRIGEAGPEYRGQPAVALAAAGLSFEAVAEWLWTGTPPEAPVRWPAPAASGAAAALPARALSRLLPAGSPPMAAPALVLPVLAAADPLRFEAEPAAVVARARRLIPCLAASFALGLESRQAANRWHAALQEGDPVRALAVALGVPLVRQPLALLRTALILCADHELNASAFAARVAASTGADLYACLAAAVAAFSGPRHGGASEQVEWLAQEAGEPARAAAAVAGRLRRGERLPGFGHALYPSGDPRVPPLMAGALALRPLSKRPRDAAARRLATLVALAEAVRATGRTGALAHANLDVALAATCAALNLPLGLAPAIFAVGRSAGWVAHVLEQQRSLSVLRPRARYVGPPAGAAPHA